MRVDYRQHVRHMREWEALLLFSLSKASSKFNDYIPRYILRSIQVNRISETKVMHVWKYPRDSSIA